VVNSYGVEKFGVIGLSTGAELAALVTALDDRAYACVSSGIFVPMEHRAFNMRIPPGCACGSDYYLGKHFRTADYFGLCAPKKLLIMHGLKDHALCPGHIPSDELKRGNYYDWMKRPLDQKAFDREYKLLQEIYANVGFPNSVELVYHEGAHAVDNKIAYEWMEKQRYEH